MTNRIILGVVVLFSTFAAACSDSTQKKPVKSVIEEKSEIRSIENMVNEDMELLAVKYKIDVALLVNVVAEYERLSLGYSITDAEYYISNKNPKPRVTTKKTEVLSIPIAIEKISEQYHIPAKTIAEILIDKKMMETARGE